MDVLRLVERIQQTIELGESQFREFKSAFEGSPNAKKPREWRSVATDIAETLVAFANAEGGELLVGVEDDGTLTGIEFRDETIENLLAAPKERVHPDTPLISPISRHLKIEEKEILYFAIEKNTERLHQTSDGKCLQRKDRENRPVAIINVQFERQEQISREYDRQFVNGASVGDLDLDVVKRVADHITKMSPEKCLQYLGLAEYKSNTLFLRRAALLLFAKEVSRWHPRCQVRIARIRGIELKTGRDYNVAPDEIVTGNILELVTAAWEKLRPHLVETKMTSDALFKERIMYPEDACREALINAITHRDYSLEGQNIEVLIFDDRMEVHSAGSLLSTIKVDDLVKLKGTHESRNALIARVLREIGYVREMGEGMRRIFRLMRDADLIAPEVVSESNHFKIILHHKSVFSETDQIWLDYYKPLKLSREEMLIALLGKNGNLISPQQIYDRLELVDWDDYRSIITQIQIKGVLYTAKPKGNRRAGIRNRAIARLAIREPENVEKHLAELYIVLAKSKGTITVNTEFLNLIIKRLPSNNSYKTNPTELANLLKLLSLIDEQKKPTVQLLSLWKEEPTSEFRTERVKHQGKEITPAKLTPRAGFSRVKNIFVGNVDYETTESELEALFSEYGNVISVKIPIDFVTQKGRGFAFIQMSSQQEADLAIKEVSGYLLRGRPLRLGW